MNLLNVSEKCEIFWQMYFDHTTTLLLEVITKINLAMSVKQNILFTCKIVLFFDLERCIKVFRYCENVDVLKCSSQLMEGKVTFIDLMEKLIKEMCFCHHWFCFLIYVFLNLCAKEMKRFGFLSPFGGSMEPEIGFTFCWNAEPSFLLWRFQFPKSASVYRRKVDEDQWLQVHLTTVN